MAEGQPTNVQKVLKKKCPLCSDQVDPKGVYVHFHNKHPEEAQNWEEWRDKFEDVEVEVSMPEEEKGPLPPPEVLVTKRVKELLAKELPRVYGIPKKNASKTITAIIDTLTPAQATDEWNLHSHVKDFASNANDRHLESIINKIFSDLQEEGYLSSEQGHQPRYGQRRSRRNYRPRYAREGASGRSFDAEENYNQPRRSSMKIVLDGQEIETDFEGYMAYERFKKDQAEEKRSQQEHELRMKRLEAEILKITAETGSNPKRDDKEVKELQDKLEREREQRLKEREERHQAEMKRLDEKIDNQPTFLEQLEYYERTGQRLGLRQTGRTTMDVIDSFRGDLQVTAQQILNKLPTPGGEFKPEVTRTPEERRKAAERIKRRLERSEAILQLEDELVKSASKVRSSSSVNRKPAKRQEKGTDTKSDQRISVTDRTCETCNNWRDGVCRSMISSLAGRLTAKTQSCSEWTEKEKPRASMHGSVV